MHLVIVFAKLDIEVGNPAEFTVDVSLLGQLGVVRHASAFHLVLLIWVELSLRMEQHLVLVLVVFVKVLLWNKSNKLG